MHASEQDIARLKVTAPLMFDLVLLLMRLRQMKNVDDHWLIDRVIKCDLPRMEKHLSEQAKGVYESFE